MRLTSRVARLLPLAVLATGPAFANPPVEGVNPADLLTQVQLTGEYNRIGDGVEQWLLVAKYDYKLPGSPIGLNFELPVQGMLDTPGGGQRGHGDLFARVRYIRPLGRWQVGTAFEVVAPVGEAPLTGGRWQTNPGVLAVYPWNARNLTAFVHKRVYGYIDGDEAMADINQYSNRFLQIHIWPTGWFAQADAQFWRDARTGADWLDARVSLGRQLDARSRLQVELKRLSGDRENDFALSVAYAVKL
jgi:hypothetical protein